MDDDNTSVNDNTPINTPILTPSSMRSDKPPLPTSNSPAISEQYNLKQQPTTHQNISPAISAKPTIASESKLKRDLQRAEMKRMIAEKRRHSQQSPITDNQLVHSAPDAVVSDKNLEQAVVILVKEKNNNPYLQLKHEKMSSERESEIADSNNSLKPVNLACDLNEDYLSNDIDVLNANETDNIQLIENDDVPLSPLVTVRVNSPYNHNKLNSTILGSSVPINSNEMNRDVDEWTHSDGLLTSDSEFDLNEVDEELYSIDPRASQYYAEDTIVYSRTSCVPDKSNTNPECSVHVESTVNYVDKIIVTDSDMNGLKSSVDDGSAISFVSVDGGKSYFDLCDEETHDACINLHDSDSSNQDNNELTTLQSQLQRLSTDNVANVSSVPTSTIMATALEYSCLLEQMQKILELPNKIEVVTQVDSNENKSNQDLEEEFDEDAFEEASCQLSDDDCDSLLTDDLPYLERTDEYNQSQDGEIDCIANSTIFQNFMSSDESLSYTKTSFFVRSTDPTLRPSYKETRALNKVNKNSSPLIGDEYDELDSLDEDNIEDEIEYIQSKSVGEIKEFLIFKLGNEKFHYVLHLLQSINSHITSDDEEEQFLCRIEDQLGSKGLPYLDLMYQILTV